MVWKNRPERITVAVYGVSALFLCLSLVVHVQGTGYEVDRLVIVVVTLAIVVSTAQLFARRLRFFLPMFVLQTVLTIVLVASTAGILHPVITITLVFSLIMSVSIRIPAQFSVIVSLSIVGITAAAGGLQTLIGWERIASLTIQVTLAGFSAIVARYRESLVSALQNLDSQRATIRNLSAANESFVEALPELKRESAENERLRITRDLHDTLGYAMTNIVMIMNAAQYLIDDDPDQVRDYCIKAKELASETMDDTRQTLYKLRAIEDETPKDPAIFFHRFCADFQEATGVQTECHPGNLTTAFKPMVFNALLKTIQVGFINALRHGKATTIRLHFWRSESDLRMTIWNSSDDVDQNMETRSEGIGLRGVRERMVILGGTMKTEYTVDGHNLTVNIPLWEEPDAGYPSFDR